ncbi:adenosylmethionine decarboxylase [Sphingomicrobium arenosum]|uniref:adenosylmethionine decarboxylase n=1 Tax=Sphingomicrobium arenosum TaxID=2233861 RepID=UPI00224080DB|nr:adenosylmethionine decarboxylase [Sphingomicrobium arenosum]
MANEIGTAGNHALLDCRGIAHGLDDPAQLERIMREAAEAARARVIAAHFHHFGEGQGVTGMLMLAESHISVHSWPEHGFAAFDIFMCGAADVERAIAVIRHAFADATIERRVIERGR